MEAVPGTIDRSPNAFQAAEDLINETPILANNPRVQKLLENDFVTEKGEELDPGNFLAAMLNYIETQGPNSEVITDQEFENRVNNALATNSLSDDVEGLTENRPV